MTNFFGHTQPPASEPPAILWHYTSQRGLLGILGGDEIWMTHTQYLNDQNEFNHAIDLVREEILRRQKTAAADGEILEQMLASAIPAASSMNVCVCCFSEDGDSLSQWRAYGGPSSGYSIGFSSAFLFKAAEIAGYGFVKCLYGNDEKVEFVRAFVSNNIAEVLAKREAGIPPDEVDHWQTGGNFGACLNRIAPILKDIAFQDEREWRIISKPLSCRNERFDYRPGASMLIPYYKFPLKNSVEQVGVKRFHSIKVGPTPNMAQARMAVGSLLAKNHLASDHTPGGPVQVEASNVPYRSW